MIAVHLSSKGNESHQCPNRRPKTLSVFHSQQRGHMCAQQPPNSDLRCPPDVGWHLTKWPNINPSHEPAATHDSNIRISLMITVLSDPEIVPQTSQQVPLVVHHPFCSIFCLLFSCTFLCVFTVEFEQHSPKKFFKRSATSLQAIAISLVLFTPKQREVW